MTSEDIAGMAVLIAVGLIQKSDKKPGQMMDEDRCDIAYVAVEIAKQIERYCS